METINLEQQNVKIKQSKPILSYGIEYTKDAVIIYRLPRKTQQDYLIRYEISNRIN